MRILVIEDEQILRVTLQDELKDQGYEVQSFGDPTRALDVFARTPAQVVLSDIRLPQMDGLQVLSRVKAIQPDAIVILMTAFGEVSSAVEAMKRGAFDYVTKPFDLEEMMILIRRGLDLYQLREENKNLRKAVEGPVLVGESEAASLLRNAVETAAGSDLTVLLTGETGTGKDLAAQLIHRSSRRADHPFVKISCAQYSRTVLESELFGHEHGAFTGASRKKRGKFSAAQAGTVYLDDVDDLVPEIQVKLLRVLDEKVIEPVGSLQHVPVDIRIVASSKKDLSRLVRQGRFRDDLFFRLNAFPIALPPLRERREDIPLLVRYGWDRMGHPEKSASLAALEALEAYDWPGNVRELKNILGRLAISSRSNVVARDELPEEVCGGTSIRSGPVSRTFDEIIASTERRLLQEALRKAGGNQSQAARSLGMKLSTFRDRVARQALDVPSSAD